jgi:FSR family fosmidomycin resistance protein-like MFS transporter
MSSIEASAADSALRRPPLTRRAAWANLTSVSGAHAYIHATSVLMPLVYPILQRQYGFSYTEIGLLVAVPSFVGGLLQLAFGYLGRYLARKAMIGVGNLVVAASMFLTGLATSFPAFMSWGILRNLGGSPQHPVGSSILTDSFGEQRHGFALAGHVAGGNLGTLLVPFVGTALIVHFGWQPTVMLFALPGIVAGTAVLLVVHEPGASAAPAAAGDGHALPQPPSPPVAGAARRDFFAPLRNRGVLLIIFASIVASGGRGVGILTTYLPLYLSSGLRLAPNVVAALFTLLLAGSVIGPLAAGRLSDRAGRRPLLLLSYGFAALFTVLLPLLAGWGLPLPLYFVEIALLGLVAYAESPLLQAYLADHAPAVQRDAAFGWYFTLAFGVGSLWGAVLGALIDRTSFAVTFFVMAASYICAAVILLWVPRTRQR